MKTIGCITFKQSRQLTPSDRFLVEPMEKAGFHVVAAPWDDTTVQWNQFDALIFRSCWNYHFHYAEFLSWLTKLESLKIPAWNSTETIRWNTDKSYLLTLEKKGIPVIPTVIVKQHSQVSPDIFSGWQDAVIKPAVGASARGIFRVDTVNLARYKRQIDTLLDQSDVLIQPMMNEVMTEGEYSFIFFDKLFSHAMLKIPKKGDFRSNYDFGATIRITQPSQTLIRQASDILGVISAPLLYARVDGIVRNGKFLLMELELTEPHLFFDMDTRAAERFTQACKTLLTGR